MVNDLLKFKRMVAGILRSVILITAVLSLAGCNSKTASEAKPKPGSITPEGKPVLVELAKVQRGKIEAILERSSALQAEVQVQVLARTQNPAVELLVEEGDKVSQGQVLLRLENFRQQTDYDQSLSQLEQVRIDFDSQQSLYDQKLISESEYRNAKFAFNQAELRSDNAKRELDYTEVRAPIQGTVTSRTVKVGDSVGTGTPIFEIIDLDSTVAMVHVPEQYIPKLQTNMAARMISTTLGDQVFEGYVKRISPIVEVPAGTTKVVVGVKELGALRPGMWMDVELVLDSKEDAILIPKRSIVYDNDQTYAFKIYTDTNDVIRARRQLVVPRNADKEHIEPMDGFAAGDIIVVAGQSGLKDDSLIRVLESAGSTQSLGSPEPPGSPGSESLVPPLSIVENSTNSISSTDKTSAQGVN